MSTDVKKAIIGIFDDDNIYHNVYGVEFVSSDDDVIKAAIDWPDLQNDRHFSFELGKCYTHRATNAGNAGTKDTMN